MTKPSPANALPLRHQARMLVDELPRSKSVQDLARAWDRHRQGLCEKPSQDLMAAIVHDRSLQRKALMQRASDELLRNDHLQARVLATAALLCTPASNRRLMQDMHQWRGKLLQRSQTMAAAEQAKKARRARHEEQVLGRIGAVGLSD